MKFFSLAVIPARLKELWPRPRSRTVKVNAARHLLISLAHRKATTANFVKEKNLSISCTYMNCTVLIRAKIIVVVNAGQPRTKELLRTRPTLD